MYNMRIFNLALMQLKIEGRTGDKNSMTLLFDRALTITNYENQQKANTSTARREKIAV